MPDNSRFVNLVVIIYPLNHLITIILYIDSSFQWCHRRTRWNSQYWLCLENLLSLLQLLEEPLLQINDPLFWLLHCCGVGLWVCHHCFLPCLVHFTMHEGLRNQLRSLPKSVHKLCKLLHCTMLWGNGWNFPSFQEMKEMRKYNYRFF